MVFRLPSRLTARFRTSATASKKARPRFSTWRNAGWACLIASAGLMTGCMTSSDELKYVGKDRDLNQYIDSDTRIEHPNVGQESPETVTNSGEARRLRNLKNDEIRDLSLEETLRTALMNAEVIRDNGQFLNPGNRLLSNPDFAQSIYDVGIQETNTLFGQGGMAAALAEFDATFTTNMTWGASEQPAESNSIGVQAFDGQRDEFGDFRAQIAKIFGHGGQVTFEHNILYTEVEQNRAGARPFNSQFSSRPTANQEGGLPTLELEYRQPLLQGAGTEYTRIAGPIARRPTLQSTPTVNQGVVIARIRTDITIAEFEGAVAQLLRDTEDTYWELYLSYRTYDAEAVATQSALETWREIRVSFEEGRVGAADEAQARDNYFESRARREDALARLLNAEVRLRRLMGLAVNDGEILRPSDAPITTELKPDWNMALAEALTNRPEVRRQKWNIKSLELQHTAAEMLVRPRLDFVARYQWNGFGDQLTGGQDGGQFRSFYDTLFDGQFQGWGLGFEFSMPLGFRGATAQVQNIEQRIAKGRAILAEQEKEISYELASTFQQIDQAYQTAKTNFNRRRAAERRVDAFTADYEAGRSTLDLVLRAQISLAQAEVAYYSSLIGYNRALNDLRFRKGTILIDNSVYLSESLWVEEAYDDALRRAWARSFAFGAPDLETHPEEFVLGCEPGTEWVGDPDQQLPEEEPIAPLSPSPGDTPTPPPADPANGEDATQPAPPADRSARLDVSGVIGGGLNNGPTYDRPVPGNQPLPLPPADDTQFLDNALPAVPERSFLPPQSSTGPMAPPMPGTPSSNAEILPAGFNDSQPQAPTIQPAANDEFLPPSVVPSTPSVSSGPTQIPDYQSPADAALPTPNQGTGNEFLPPVDVAPPMPSGDAFQPPRLVPSARRNRLENAPGPQPPTLGQNTSRARLIGTGPGNVPEIVEPLDGFTPDADSPSAAANTGTGITPVDYEFPATPAATTEQPQPTPRKKTLLPKWDSFLKRD